MFTAILITVLPTLLTSILLPKAGLKPKSVFLAITLYWLSGIFLFTVFTYFVAVLYNNFTTEVLLKATYAVLLVVQVFLLFLIKDVHHLFVSLKHGIKPLNRKHITSLLLVAFCISFSYAFYAHNLKIENEKIYTTNIYWDFHWHAALINNFAFGDNFPPENEAFSGLPHTYHYFWGVVAAMYEVVGLNLADAINYISILAFCFVLLGLIGLSEELFHSRVIGFLAVILTLTSSSLHFINYFAARSQESLGQILNGILTSTQHPWFASFLPGNAYGYNGTMMNLFYFLEERQLIFGVVYMLIAVWLLYKRQEFSNKVLFCVGAAMGGFFLWHLFVTITVLCAMCFLLLFGKDRKKTLMMLAGFSLIFGAHIIYFKEVMRSEWFDKSIIGYPRLDFDFASGEHEPFSWHDVIVFYIYSYGTKLIFIAYGLIYLFKHNKRIFLLLTAILLPTFVLLNTIQLSPSSIYENHKWFRPMNVIVDLAVAFILFKLFFEEKNKLKKSFGFMWLFFLTISGIIELTPFLNAQPSDVYAAYPSSITKAISENSPPRSSFTGSDIYEINLAGRKVFLGNNLGGDMAFKKGKRLEIIHDIYKTTNLTKFCAITQQYKIDFVEFDKDSFSPLKELALAFPHFSATNAANEPVYFVDIKKSCREL
jgi:hypothetical protein